jgi:stringent starvation protein B
MASDSSRERVSQFLAVGRKRPDFFGVSRFVDERIIEYNYEPLSAGRMGSPDRPSKHTAFLALMQEGRTSLHLDARRAGVVVPEHLKGEAHLVLQYGTDLPIAIPDLSVDEHGVSATLSFNRAPHRTVVPWSAVYVVVSDEGRGVLYNEDVPPDVAVIAGATDGEPGDAADLDETEMLGAAGLAPHAGAGPHPVAEEIPSRRSSNRALQAVPLGAHQTENDSLSVMNGPPVGMPPRRRRRPQLRLVK